MARDYAEEYREYHSKPSQRKNRSNRNKARRLMIKKHGKAKLKGKDVDHKHPMKKGGGNGMKNLRIRSVKANRGDKSF
jgi:hypothetical protein